MFAHLLRGGAVMMLVIILYSAMRQPFTFTAPGLHVFTAVMWVNYMFITIAAVGYFATSITEEKEEDTLGLLQMAGISPLALLLGKSVSRLWLAIVLICIQIPFALLAITLGGVSLRQVLGTYVSLGAYTFFLSGIATFCSVATRRSLRAVVYMIVASILVTMTPEITDGIDDLFEINTSAATADRAAVVTQAIRRVSVTTRLQGVMSIGFDDPILEEHFIASVSGGLFFFVMSWLTFNFFAFRHTDNSPARVGRAVKTALGLHPGRTWLKAIPWKDFHFGSGGYWGWIVRLILLAVGTTAFCLPGWYYNPDYFDRDDVGDILLGVTLAIMFLEATLQSVRLLSDEHAQKTLPHLAMMPWSPARTIYSKLAGAALGLVPNLFAIVIAIFLHPKIVPDFMDSLTRGADEFFGWCYLFVVICAYLHLNAFLATYIRWGAVPVSFGILLAFTMCCIFTFSPRGPSGAGAMFFMMSVFGTLVTAALHFLVGQRFHELKSR